MDWEEKIGSVSSIAQKDAFWIECPVPTMLLRWKRALYESCDNWDGECPTGLRELVPIQIVEVDEDENDENEDHEVGEQDSKEEESSESTESPESPTGGE